MMAGSFLKIKQIQSNPSLVKLLPAEIAEKYHALPISRDGCQTTVAAAYPDDAESFKAISSAIPGPIRFIRADLEEIDRLIINLWPKEISRKKILLWNTGPGSMALYPYARTFSDLINGSLTQAGSGSILHRPAQELSNLISEFKPDIILLHSESVFFLRKLISNWDLLEGSPSLLFLAADDPCQIEKVLLPVLDDHADVDLAVDWIVEIARFSQIEVTILPLLPPIPALYGRLIHHSISALLEDKDPLGLKIRKISDRFSAEDIPEVLILEEGDAFDQILQLNSKSSFDLIVLSSSLKDLKRAWGKGNLVRLLGDWLSKPVLIPSLKE